MRILYIGSVQFSESCLQLLLSMNSSVVGVITKSDSKFNADHVDLSPICKANSIPYIFAKDLSEKSVYNWMMEKKADVIFCFGWSHILGKDILQMTSMGVVGFHPAALPLNRGRHPIIWALALGLNHTASTFFLMNEGADSGDILSQRFIIINYGDDAASLYAKITATALEQIAKIVPELESGDINPIIQDNKIANSWRKRGIDDGKIDFRMHSRTIYNLVRALTRPYVGAHIVLNKKQYKVWKVREVDCGLNNIEPGNILNIDSSGILIKCSNNAILIVKHEIETDLKIGDYL